MKKLSFDELVQVIKGLSDKNVMLSFHSVGDTDSVSSAFALRSVLKSAKVATPDIVTANARRILQTFGFDPDVITSEFDASVEAVVLTDVNNFEDCGQFLQKLESFPGKIIIIDHHVQHEIAKENVYAYNDESYNSAASIVYAVMQKLGSRPDANLASVIAAGIVSDSAEFRNSSGLTFSQLGDLLTIAKLDYSTLVSKITHLSDPDARSMTIKDLQGAAVEVVQGLLFVHGQAHAHANLAADHAIRIGADVALFSAETERELSFSARLRPPLDTELGIHLGRIMKRLGPLIGGTGGGHPCAAGAYGPLRAQTHDFAERFIEEITSRAEPI